MPTKARARKLARFLNVRARRTGAVQRHHLRDQPGRLLVGAAAAEARRRHPAHAHGAPRQHRAVAAGRRAHRRDDQGRRARRPTASSTSTRCTRLLTPDVKLLAARPTSPTCSARSIRCARSAAKRASAASSPSSTARRPLPHRAVDIAAIGCDFYAFTGHKMCGPTGTGALWARREHLAAMPPFLGGGEMIKEVRFEGTVFNDAPHKFEAGTPNIAGFIGLGAAVDYLSALGMAQRRGARAGAAGARHRGAARRSTACASSARAREQGGGDQLPGRRRARARPGHPARPGRRRDPLRPPLRASADAVLRRRRPPAAPRSRSTTRTTRSNAFVAALRKVRSLLGYDLRTCLRIRDASAMTDLTIPRRRPHADIDALVALVDSAYRGDASKQGWTTEADLLDGRRIDADVLRQDLIDAQRSLRAASPSATARTARLRARRRRGRRRLFRHVLGAPDAAGRRHRQARARRSRAHRARGLGPAGDAHDRDRHPR